MARNLKIRDLTLRDGQQSSFATRMSQAQVDRCLPYYKDANFYAMEVWGGAVPDSVMRYLNENPWTRLETIHKAVGNVSKLTALSRGRNLFGYAPYTDEVIDGFCRNSIRERAGHHAYLRRPERRGQRKIDRQIRQAVRRHRRLRGLLYGRSEIPRTGFLRQAHGQEAATEPVFTDAYFLDKAEQMAALGADMITIKDMSGLIPPRRVATLVKLFKKNIDDSGRFPYPLYARLRPGIGACGHHRRRRRRRYQLLVFRRRHGRPGHRAGPRLLQEARRRYRREHGGRRQDQHPAARDPQGTQPVGIRRGETRTQSRSTRSPTRCPPRSTRCSTRRSRPLRPTTRPRRSTPAARSRLTSASRLPTNWCRRPRFPAACIRTWSPSSSSSRPRISCRAPWS